MLLFSPQVCGNFLQQPQELNTACSLWPVLVGTCGTFLPQRAGIRTGRLSLTGEGANTGGACHRARLGARKLTCSQVQWGYFVAISLSHEYISQLVLKIGNLIWHVLREPQLISCVLV